MMENIFYKNRGSKTTRNQDITEYLFFELSNAILRVYGPDHRGHIYSGGQDRRGKGARRTGTVRHDNYGKGGRAADVYIYDKDMNKLTGAELAPLVQYWAAQKIGGVGIEMPVGGVHLDQWAKPPSSRGGMFWYYKYGSGTSARKVQRNAVAAGLKGIMPELFQPSKPLLDPPPKRRSWWRRWL